MRLVRIFGDKVGTPVGKKRIVNISILVLELETGIERNKEGV
jgi:hypothetical protein